MTHEEWKKLSPEEQQTKVAVLAGWQTHKTYWWNPDLDQFRPLSDDGIRTFARLPQYLSDLNAMQQAHQILHDAGRFEEYVRILASLSQGHTTAIVKVAEATAEQQAEAFVLTLTQKGE